MRRKTKRNEEKVKDGTRAKQRKGEMEMNKRKQEQ